jgi:hypothetical protein
MTCPAVDNPASCGIRAVITFLHAKNMSAVETNHELCMVYGQHVTSEGTARQGCRVFKDGWANVHDEERSGRSSVVTDGLVQNIDQKICERWRFTITLMLISTNFTHCSLRDYHS